MPKRSTGGDALRRPTPRLTATQREERVRTLERLFELFRGHDAATEIRRLKEQDEGS